MPEAPAKPTTAQQQDELLLLAEKIGEVSDRLAQIETEFTAQTAPLDSARATQDSALAALNAALAGIKALNFHVLDNNLGAVSRRVETVAAQATKCIEVLDAKFTDFERERERTAKELSEKFNLTEQRRTELAAKREADAQQFARAQESLRHEFFEKISNITADLKRIADATPTAFNPRGDWDAHTNYTKLDVVTLNGTSYVSRESDNTEKPGRGSKRWQVLARRGGAALGGGATDITGVAGMGVTGLQLAQAGTDAEAREILGVSDMVGATASDDGAAGRVHQPRAGDQNKYWRGDGTWSTPATVTAPAASQSTVNTGTADDEFVAPLTLHGYVNPLLATRAVAPFLLFDGATSGLRAYVPLGAAGAVGSTHDFTVTSLIDGFVSLSANMGGTLFLVPSASSGSGADSLYYYVTSDGTLTYVKRSAADAFQTLFSISAFTINHGGKLTRITLRRQAGTWELFFNGVSQGTTTKYGTDNIASGYLVSGLTTTMPFKGRADAPLLILGALSDAEILKHAQTGLLPNWCYAGTGSAVAQTSGTLTIGRKYRIKTYVATDVFTNVGAASNATGVEFVATGTTPTTWINSSELLTLGPIARHTLQPGATVHPDDGANKLPLLLTSGVTAVGSTPNEVVIPGPAMTADGFVHADQVITPTGYELVAAYALQTGTATSTITVKETSSGGTTVATGALSASVTRVALTVSNGLLAGGKKLHLANSSWASNTVTPFFVFRRAS